MISLQQLSFSHMLVYFFGVSDKFCIFRLYWAWFLNYWKTTKKRAYFWNGHKTPMSLSAGWQSQKKTATKQENGTIKWLKDESHLNHGCHKLCTKNSCWTSKIFKFPNGCGKISTQHALPMLCWIAVSSYSNSNSNSNSNCGNYEMTYVFDQ